MSHYVRPNTVPALVKRYGQGAVLDVWISNFGGPSHAGQWRVEGRSLVMDRDADAVDYYARRGIKTINQWIKYYASVNGYTPYIVKAELAKRSNPVLRRYKSVGEMRKAGVPDNFNFSGNHVVLYESGEQRPFSEHSGHYLFSGKAPTTLMRRRPVGSDPMDAEHTVSGRYDEYGRRFIDRRTNGQRGARLRNHHLQVGDFVKYTPAGRSAFQGGKLFGHQRRGTVRDVGPNDRYAVAWTDSGGNVQDNVPDKYLERAERASGGAYFGPVLRNPAAKWTDGDTTSVLSHGHHGRILVTATARYVNRYLGAGEARKGWYALYLHDEPAGPEFWGSGTKTVCLGHAGPYTSRAAAKAAGSKRWKSWGTP